MKLDKRNNINMSFRRKNVYNAQEGTINFDRSSFSQKNLHFRSSDSMVFKDPQITPPRAGSDKLRSDKSRLFRKFDQSKRTNDISHIRDYNKPRFLSQTDFPTALETMQVLEKLDKRTQKRRLKKSFSMIKLDDESLDKHIQNFCLASGRQGALNLRVWIDTMKARSNIEEALDGDIELIEAAELIYAAALREIIRQVSWHCIDRAELLREIVDVLSKLWKRKAPEYQRLLERHRSQHSIEVSSVRQKYLDKISRMYSHIRSLEIQKERLIEENKKFEHTNTVLQTQVQGFLVARGVNTKQRRDFSHQAYIKQGIAEKETQTALYGKLKSAVLEVMRMRRAMSSIGPDVSHMQDESQSSMSYEISSGRDTPRSDNTGDLSMNLIDSLMAKDSITMEDLQVLLGQSSPEWQEGFSIGANLYRKLEKKSVGTSTDDVISFSIPDLQGELLNVNQDASFLGSSRSSIAEGKPNLSRSRTQSRNLKTSVTKIVEFQFSRRNTLSSIKSPSSVVKLVEKFVAQPVENIQKYSTLTKNNLTKQICSMFYAAKTKTRNLENSASPTAFIFDELTLKYSIPEIAKRKFKELVASSSFNYENKKVRLFLRAAGAGMLIYENNLSVEACLLCVNCYQFMLSGDTNLYIWTKALDCLKAHVEQLLNKNEYPDLIGILEDLCIEDPNKMTKIGYIDVDVFVETIVNYYQNCRGNLLENQNQTQ